MAGTITWDTAFEALPPDTGEYASVGAERIRDTKLYLSDTLDVEHNFSEKSPKTGTGYHLPGLTSVAYVGTTTQVNALTGMHQGALAYDTTLNVWKVYSGSAWVSRGADMDHGGLGGLTDDDHPRYLSLNKAGQTIAQNVGVGNGVTIDGRDLSADGSKVDEMYARDLPAYTTGLTAALNNTILAVNTPYGPIAYDAILLLRVYFSATGNMGLQLSANGIDYTTVQSSVQVGAAYKNWTCPIPAGYYYNLSSTSFSGTINLNYFSLT
jgi:hypothetical protein